MWLFIWIKCVRLDFYLKTGSSGLHFAKTPHNYLILKTLRKNFQLLNSLTFFVWSHPCWPPVEDFQVIEFSTTIIWALNEGISFGRMVFIHPVKLQRRPEVTRPAVVAPAGPLIAFYMSTIFPFGSSPCFAWLPTTKSLLQLTCQTLHIPLSPRFMSSLTRC